MNRALHIITVLLLLGAGCVPQPEAAAAPIETSGDSTSVSMERVAIPKQPPPESGPARDVQFPEIVRARTQEGLELNTVSLPQLPIVEIRLVVRSGSASDPKALPGLAQLTAAMMNEGTYKKTSAQLAEAVDFLGARLHIDNDEEHVFVTIRALSEHLDEAMGILGEVVMRPRFDEAELKKLKTREEARLALSSQNPNFLVAREFFRALYGDHPYAHVDTTLAVVKKLKRSDLQKWHRRHFGPNNAFLVVVGDATPQQVRRASARAFKGWAERKIPKTEYVEPPTRSQREVLIIDRPESVQSVIFVGNMAIERGHADYIPLLVANQVLGGSAASRLFMDLREKQSLTYGAYSRVYESVGVAPFRAYAAVRNEVTAQAMTAFMQHLGRISAEATPAEELAQSKRYLVDRFPLRIDTPGKIAGLVADLRIYDLPDNYWDGFRGQIEGVTADAALAAAKKHIREGTGLIVVVGKAADIREPLSKYGPVTVVDTEGNVLVPPQAAPGPPAAATDPPAIEPAKKGP